MLSLFESETIDQIARNLAMSAGYFIDLCAEHKKLPIVEIIIDGYGFSINKEDVVPEHYKRSNFDWAVNSLLKKFNSQMETFEIDYTRGTKYQTISENAYAIQGSNMCSYKVVIVKEK